MNQLLALSKTKGSQAVSIFAEMDDLAAASSAIEDISNTVWHAARDELDYASQADRRIAELTALDLTQPKLIELRKRISAGLSEAPSREITQQLAILVDCFPAASNAQNPECYGKTMREEVLAVRPSILALSTACRRLRQTLKWPPAISEVLDAIKGAETTWRGRLKCVESVAERREEALTKLKAERGRLAAIEDHRRRRIAAEIAELRTELEQTLQAEREGYAGRCKSHALQEQIKRLEGRLADLGTRGA